MLVIGLGVGACLGAVIAWQRKGNLLDILQYAAGYGIAFGLVFLMLGIFWVRMG